MNSFTLKTSLFFFVLLTIASCDLEPDNNNPNAGVVKDKDGVIIEGYFRQFWDNGNLSAEMTFKDKKLHGRAVKYYKDGKTKRSELHYNMGKLDGKQTKYYESGGVYKEEMYKDGKRQGLTRKFREGGQLMSEAIYKNGFPGTELKEYLTDGKRKKKYPKIIVETEETLLKNGTYTLKVFLSDKSKNVKFYLGKLDEGKFFHDELAEQYDVEDGVLTYTFYLTPGHKLEQHFDFVARTPTRLNNTFITTHSYTAKIRFPY